MSRVGERIKEAREKSGMTQKALAKKLGVAEKFVIGGNLLGYVGEVNSEMLRRYPSYQAGEYVGISGVESAKVKESLSSVLPITLIVLVLSVTLVPMEIGTLALFLTGDLLAQGTEQLVLQRHLPILGA